MVDRNKRDSTAKIKGDWRVGAKYGVFSKMHVSMLWDALFYSLMSITLVIVASESQYMK